MIKEEIRLEYVPHLKLYAVYFGVPSSSFAPPSFTGRNFPFILVRSVNFRVFEKTGEIGGDSMAGKLPLRMQMSSLYVYDLKV